jgi:acyl-CoA dehydrogenase
MTASPSPRALELRARLEQFIATHIAPIEAEVWAFRDDPATRWQEHAGLESLKARARAEGLWNLFLPESDHGAGLSNLDYAPLAEVMGRIEFASEVFNCSAPDTGNMEILHRYGTDEQKATWLAPLLRGEIRSGFAMTEPGVASSDAANIETRIERDGADYVINGRKWWTSNAPHPRCDLFIVMGKSSPDAPRHSQHAMVLVPRRAPGVTVLRSLNVFGYADGPHGHGEVQFTDVRVPVTNILLGEGRGFEIAQGRLGPGRIHHCMRLIGLAQRALESMCTRARSRQTFGTVISDHGTVRDMIARSACDVEQARLLTLAAAEKMDRVGNKAARDLIAMIKIVAPSMAQRVVDRAIQVHGGAGVSQDFFLAHAFSYARQIRLADGPDEVHVMALARQLVRTYAGTSAV